VDDFAKNLPALWEKHGGVFIPLYQSEALWINFDSHYPCAVKIAAGKINAVSGQAWTMGLDADPQDYLVIPDQPWLDGFNVAEGLIRQFVAMPLGEGFTAEEQITGEAEHGGLQIIVYPIKAEIYDEYFEDPESEMDYTYRPLFCRRNDVVNESKAFDMGLAPGGLMRQIIHQDEYGLDVWDQSSGYRCFVHLANSECYETVTGHPPPHRPPSAKEYTDAGLPWFEHYADKQAVPGAQPLSKLTSVGAKMVELGKGVMSDNLPLKPKIIKTIGHVVREGDF